MKQARSLAFVCAAAGAAVALVACGDTFINPPHNLRRPSDVIVVSALPVTDTSAEYAMVLDTEQAQVLVIDVVSRTLADLQFDIPGYNGVFLGGQPTGMAARPDMAEVVVANFGLGRLQIVRSPVAPIAPGTTTPTKVEIVKSIDVGSGPERVAVVGNFAYVTRPRAGLIVKVDLVSRGVVGSFDVGGSPRGLASSIDGKRLFVADGASNALTRITLATGEQKTITVGGPTELVFVSPNPEWVYTLRSDRGSLVVIDPSTEAVYDPYPDGPPGAGPDITLPGRITGMAFQTFTAAENFAVGVGQMAFVTAADGIVYLLSTDGSTPHRELNKSPPLRDGGTVDCLTARWTSDAGVQNACPRLQITPQLSIGATALAVSAVTPVIVDYSLAPEFGVHLSKGRRVVRTEQWNFTYEGTVPVSPTLATLKGNVLRNPDERFSDLIVPGTSEKVLRDGDLVIITDAPANVGSVVTDGGTTASGDGGVVNCASMELERNGQRRRRWTLRLSGLAPGELILTPQDGSQQPPFEACYTQGKVHYEVRVANAWLAQGDQSGVQGRAKECPRAGADGGVTVDCTPYIYTNPFFSLTIRQGGEDSFDDLRWSFQTNDGVTPAVVSLNVSSGLAGVPRAAAASRRSARTVLVIDESDESLVFIDGRIPQIDIILR